MKRTLILMNISTTITPLLPKTLDLGPVHKIMPVPSWCRSAPIHRIANTT